MTDHDPIAAGAIAFALQTLRLTLWLVFLVCVFVPLERLFALHPARLWRKQAGVDLGWYVINSLLPAVILAVPIAALSRALRGLDPAGLYSAVAAWPLWLKTIAVLVVSDFGAYWGHRALHSVPFLWRFHAVHHSAEQMDWLVNSRAHPFDIVLTRLAGLAPVYLLGLGQARGGQIDPAIAAITIAGMTWTFFIHANVRCRLGPLEWLVSSPAFHHWHHTNDKHRDRNFAALFPWIDRLFGTAWLPKYWPAVYGTDTKVASSLTGQLLDPLGPKPECRSFPQKGGETPG